MPEDEPIRALGQYLKYMLSRLSHYLENLVDIVEWDLFMEEIAHTVDEDSSRGSPTDWQLKTIGMERDLAEIPPTPALGQALGITEFASG